MCLSKQVGTAERGGGWPSGDVRLTDRRGSSQRVGPGESAQVSSRDGVKAGMGLWPGR